MMNFPIESMTELSFEVILANKRKKREDYNFVPLVFLDVPKGYLEPKELLADLVPKDAEIVTNYHLHTYERVKDSKDFGISCYGTALIPKN